MKDLIWSLMYIIAYGLVYFKLNRISVNTNIISEAIHRYHLDYMKKYDENIDYKTFDYEVNYSDILSYTTCFLHPGIWSYKQILPKDKYEIIKEYIRR